jgi:hypothetical protein
MRKLQALLHRIGLIMVHHLINTFCIDIECVDCEVIFQVSTLMPNKEPSTKVRSIFEDLIVTFALQQIHKTRLVNNNKVLITWCEDLDNYTYDFLLMKSKLIPNLAPRKTATVY